MLGRHRRRAVAGRNCTCRHRRKPDRSPAVTDTTATIAVTDESFAQDVLANEDRSLVGEYVLGERLVGDGDGGGGVGHSGAPIRFSAVSACAVSASHRSASMAAEHPVPAAGAAFR